MEEAGVAGSWGEMELRVNQETKLFTFSFGSQTILSKKQQMGGQLEGQKLPEGAYKRDPNVHLRVANDDGRSVVHLTKRFLTV